MQRRRHGTCRATILGLLAVALLVSPSSFAQTIVQQAQLLPNGAAGDTIGQSLAVDGTTLVVGAPQDDVGDHGSQGTAYVYVLVDGVWTLQAKLLASDGEAGDQFGTSVAIDGDTVVVGAPYDDIGAVMDQGSAYVFVRSGTTWTQQQRLSVGGAAVDMFGFSVAVSGDRVLVGAPLDDVGASENQGTAYSFTRSHGAWSAESTFKGSGAQERNGYAVALLDTVAAVGAPMATANAHAEQGLVRTYAYVSGEWSPPVPVTPAAGAASDRFGVSVALDGKSLIAGAYQKAVSGHVRQGAAFVFVAGVGGWTEQATLVASDGAADDYFGTSVAIDGDTALVGVPYDDVSAASSQGSAYVFTRSGSTWFQRARLLGVGGAATDEFGRSVALLPGLAAVGAPLDDVAGRTNEGTVTVFAGGGSTWTPAAWLGGYGPEQAPWFGDSVAVSGDTLVVGASRDTVAAASGAVYVFVRSGLTWTLQAHFAGSDSVTADSFGASVALAGDTLVVGAPWHDSAASNGGAVYVFTRSGGTWTQQAKLTASDAASMDFFGESVAIAAGTIVVGATGADVAPVADAGAAYVYEPSGGTWTQRGKLVAPARAIHDGFGSSVALAGTTVVVGAPGGDSGATDAGAAHVFTKPSATWTWQATLTPALLHEGATCGGAVAVQDDTALVGCAGEPVGTRSRAGAVHVYTRTGSTWAPSATLVAADPTSNGTLGTALAFEGDNAVAGASLASALAGALYVFSRVEGTWQQVQRLAVAGAKPGDLFGSTVGLSGDLAVGGTNSAMVAGLDFSGYAAVFGGLCGFGLTPATVSAGAASGTQSVSVNASASACAWSTTSQAAWLTFDAPGTGTGDGAVTVRYTANTGPARTGTMTIAEQTFTVNQAGGCTFTLGATSAPMGAAGGNGGVSFTASNAACPWTASSNVPWMSVSPPDTGTGSGAVTYVVLPNPGPERSGTLTVAGLAFTVTQAFGCSYALTPATTTSVAAGGNATVQVTASDAACPWSVTSNVAWLSAPLGFSGIGSSTVTWAAAGNLGPARTGTMTIAGLTFTVNQAGGCTYFVTPEDLSVSALGGFASLALIASDGGCPWTAASNVTWAAISSAPAGTGSATVNVAVEPNTGAARSGTLTVAGRTIDVDQPAWGCTFTVAPLTVDAPAAGLSGTVSITAAHAGCAWTVGAAPPWITFPNGSSGSGSASLAYVVAANPTPSVRQAAFTVGGYAVAVTQAASTCGFTVDPAALTFAAGGSTKVVTLGAAGASCAWTVTGAPAWLAVTPVSGSGPATISVRASANDDTARAATLTIAGLGVAVAQDGSATPAGAMTRYLAEGATSGFFDMRLALLNTGNTPDEVTLRYLTRDGATPSVQVTVPPLTRATVWPETLLGDAEFSTVVESSGPIVVDRTMTWDARGYGSHAETAVAGPALEWFLAEGATHSGFDLFYLIQNPNAVAAEVEVRYLRPAPQPQLTRTYTVPARTRFNIWVDYEGPEFADTDVSAVIRATNGQPVIVERAMYKSVPGHNFNAGHESAGVTAPATRWLLAEGATGPYFDLFVLLANPDPRAADVRVTYLLPDGTTYTKTLTVAGASRSNIWVDYDTPDGTTGTPLADTAVSTTVEVTNGVPIIVERAMWWPTGPATWFEAHNSAGATAAGTRWALAEGEAGGPSAVETYILIANTSPTPGEAAVTLLFEDGTSAHRTYALPALSRTNVPVLFDFPMSAGRRFGALVESLGDTPAQIVVERAMYSDAEGVHWAAGSNALATRLR